MIKIIEGFPDYCIDDLGNVYDSNGIINDRRLFDQHGYLVVQLFDGECFRLKKVHRLVAMAFIPNPENKPTVNHKDGNKHNNCVSNLEWATNSEQLIHAANIGLIDIDKRAENMRKAQKLSPSSKKGYARPSAYKPVAFTDLDGNILLKFKSTKDAIDYVTSKGWNPYCVVDCLRGHQKTIGPNRDITVIRL